MEAGAGAFAFGPTELALAAVSPEFCDCLSLDGACCCPSCPVPPPLAHSAADCLSMKSVSGVFARIFGSGTFRPCSIWAMIMFMSSMSIRFQSSSRSFSRFFSLNLQHKDMFEQYKEILLSFHFVVGRQFVEQLAIHLHERLQHIVDQGDYCLVPMLLADAVKCREHDRHDVRTAVLNQ